MKPGLFKNELLGKADPLLTILFAGLWCLADREGRLEDRPLKICGELFPHRRSVTEKKTDAMLQWLHEHEFIARYTVGSSKFIQVYAFLKHQNPHVKERPSTIPALSSIQHSARTGQASGSALPFPERARLTPSSLTPDSGLLTPSSSPPESKTPQPPTSGGPVVDGDREESEQGRREDASNPRARGTNPRAIAEVHDAQQERQRFDADCRRAREEFGLPDFRAPYPVESLEAYRTALRTAAPRKAGAPRFSAAPKGGAT